MLAEYFRSPIRIEEIRDCPAGQLLEGFTRELHQAGYAQLTARRHLRAAEHFVHWTRGRGCPFQPWKIDLSRSFLSIWIYADAQGTVVRVGRSWSTASVCLSGISGALAY